ncbi:hypothetical protein SUDANB15_07440 (plasmid) [Streptomyces sp. enrichment culture]|uniref:lantibiotic dehydratase n=1 Tax=Streptomyces sp. enrichment culture TaxID=1795815 RepID=UPI003F56DE8D
MKPLPDPVVRVAGIERSALTALRAPRTFALAEDVLRRGKRLAEEGGRLADALHSVIGTLSDRTTRPYVIGLRRALHQGRAPRPAEWHPTVRSVLPYLLTVRIQRWLDARERLAEDEKALAYAFDRESHQGAAALCETLAHPRLRRGLLSAAPALDDALERRLAVPDGRPFSTKTLVSLARYLSRAALKTSPQGSFTATGQARWTAHGPWLTFGDLEHRLTTVEVNLARLRRIVDALLASSPSLRDSLPLRANPALYVGASGIRLIPPGPAARVAALPAPERSDRLSAALARLDGVTLADAGPTVRRFLAAGLLQADIPLDDLDACPLGSLVTWLGAEGSAVPEDIVVELAALRSALHTHAAPRSHAALRADDRLVRDRLDAIERRLRLPPADEPYAHRPFHEDSVFAHDVATLGRAVWQPVLTDLAAVGDVLALLDRDLPARYAVAAWFAGRYGTGASVPLLVLLHDLEEDRSPAAERIRALLRPGFGVDENLLRDSPLPTLRRLARERARARRALAEGRMPLSAEAPRSPLSLAYYVQPLPGADAGPRVVLNAVTVGHGHWQGRLDRMRARAEGRPRPAGPAPIGTADRIPVDIGGLYASNTNLRHRTQPHHFDHPFTRGSEKTPTRIPLGDVTVHLDETCGLLALRTPDCDAELVPVHLGLMSPLLLPPPLTTLLRLFGDPHTLFRTGHPLSPGPFTDDVPREGVRDLPRIEAGRVVLRRRGWLTRAGAVPLRSPGEREHAHYLRLLAWRREVGLPERCFVRTGLLSSASTAAFADKGYKPAYVDFASPLLTTAFTRSLGHPDTVVHLEEALPDPAAPHHDAPHTSEFIIELPRDLHAAHP